MGRPKSAQKATPKNKRAPFRLSLKFPQKPSKPTIASENGAEDFGKETKQVESGQVVVVQDLPVQKKLSETCEEVLMSPGKKVLIKRVGAHNPIRKSKDLLLMKAVVMLTRLDSTLLQNDMINALTFERSNTKENAQPTNMSSIVTVEPEPDAPMALELSDISSQTDESPEVPVEMVDTLVTFTDKNSTVSTVVLDQPNPDEGGSVPDMNNSITSVSDFPLCESSVQQTVSGESLEPSSSSRCLSTSDSTQGAFILPTVRPGLSKKKKMANQQKPESSKPSFPSRCVSTSDSAQGILILPTVRPGSSKNKKMASQRKSETIRDSGSVMTSNCDLFHGLLDRVYLEPPTGKLCNLQSNPHMRQVAPYAMRAGPTSDEYFQYVAVVAEEDDAKFCCVVFGLVEQCLSAFSGHFLVPKERLFDPVNKIPASEIAVMPSERSRLHMGLFGVPNKTLIGYDGYFVQGGRGSYARVVSQFLEMFMSAVDQVRLKEKTKCEVALACGSGNRDGAPRDVLRRVSSNRVVKRKAVSRLRRSFVEVPMDPLGDF